MTDLTLTRTLEQHCFNAWPALRTLFVDGWVVRLSDGHTRRANSASALYPSSQLGADSVGAVRRLFERAKLTPIFRLTPLAPLACADVLAGQGWREDDPSFGMFAEHIGPIGVQSGAVIEPIATDLWLSGAMNAYGYGIAGERSLRRMLANLVLPAAFATIVVDDDAVAWGLAVAEANVVGLYDLVVSPTARGRGIGRKLMRVLLAWGRMQGATAAYLQVRADNDAARVLYRSFGFRDAYRYTHWIDAEYKIGRGDADAYIIT
jgi:ribosomal protein S18 acetylase RimI-like enzyme